jgi:pimeloyl-ACP methyl ester carboxylesterase
MFGLAMMLLLAAAIVVLLTGWLYAHAAQRPLRRTAAFAISNNLACDPGERGLPFDQWRLTTRNGVELDVWDVQPQRDHSFNGRVLPTVILVHGWSASRIHMLQRIDSYLPHASRIILFDLRGHGESGGLSGLGHDDHLDLLELIERAGDEHIVLASHSMGASVAIAAAAQADHPASLKIRGVIAQGAFADFSSSMRRRVNLLGLPGSPFTGIGLMLLRLKGFRHRPLAQVAAGLRCPLMFLQGQHDEICPPCELEATVAAAPDGVMHVFPGAKHSDLADVDPTRHDALIQNFIERVMRDSLPKPRDVSKTNRLPHRSAAELPTPASVS